MDKSRGDYSEKWIDYLAQINQYITEELIRSLKEKMQPEEAVKEAEW
jgi:hypothetical protein